MNWLIYNPYLLYINSIGFKIIGLQTDDILFFTNKTFIKAKEIKL